MALAFRINGRSGVPVYLQLENQVRQAMRLGLVAEGDQLPTVKEVARALAINPNTVHKAYQNLEREGLLRTRQGQGTFVHRGLATVTSADRVQLERELRRWFKAARRSGLDADSINSLIEAVAEQFERGEAQQDSA